MSKLDTVLYIAEPLFSVLVLDNAGFELVTDLCLLTILTEAGLTTSLTIHPKTRPWFVSDTTRTDLSWTIDTLRYSTGLILDILR